MTLTFTLVLYGQFFIRLQELCFGSTTNLRSFVDHHLYGVPFPPKIQCSILPSTLHNLSYILCLSFEFALAIQLFCIQLWFMQHSIIQVFAFDIQLLISISQVFEFDLQVQWNVHSLFRIRHLAFVLQVFASHIRLWALYLQVSVFDSPFDIELFELNFYPLVSDRWRSWVQLT